jgi:GTPase
MENSPTVNLGAANISSSTVATTSASSLVAQCGTSIVNSISNQPSPSFPFEVFFSPENQSLIQVPDPYIKSDLPGGWSMIRRAPASFDQVPEIRCAVLGNVDAGKSTLLGSLTRGIRDDGRGKARACIFRHAHEIESGRTSSVGQEVIAFDVRGCQILSTSSTIVTNQNQLWNEICPKAAKLVTLFDLAGHEKYLRTTMFGLSGTLPSYTLLLVGANDGGSLVGMTKEHLMLAWALSLPVIVVITKIDLAPQEIKEATITSITKTIKKLSNSRKSAFMIKDCADAVTASTLLSHVCPVLCVSSVSGFGLDHLITILNALPLNSEPLKNQFDSDPTGVEFLVNETYSVTGVGTVVSGSLQSGTIKAGQIYYLGPDTSGHFLPVTIKSIHFKRINVLTASAPHTVALALKKTKKSLIRRGTVILSSPTSVFWEFSADILVLFQHSTTITAKYQAVIHCGVVRQTAFVVHIDGDGVLRTGDRARVRFRFTRYPEYLKTGSRILFREGRTKGVGKIAELHHTSLNQ